MKKIFLTVLLTLSLAVPAFAEQQLAMLMSSFGGFLAPPPPPPFTGFTDTFDGTGTLSSHWESVSWASQGASSTSGRVSDVWSAYIASVNGTDYATATYEGTDSVPVATGMILAGDVTFPATVTAGKNLGVQFNMRNASSVGLVNLLVLSPAVSDTGTLNITVGSYSAAGAYAVEWISTTITGRSHSWKVVTTDSTHVDLYQDGSLYHANILHHATLGTNVKAQLIMVSTDATYRTITADNFKIGTGQ